MFKVSGNINKHYNVFLKWYCINNILCGIEGVFATHNMLNTLNVPVQSNSFIGIEVNDALNFSLNYIGKDIIGQIFGLSVVNKFAAYGDKDQKKYIIINSIIYEGSAMLESCTPLINPNYFIFVGALGNIGKNIGFNAFGAIRMKALKELSTSENVSEMYTKVNVATTLSYTFGMCIGLGLIKLIPCYYTRIGMIPFIGLFRYYTLQRSIKFLQLPN